MIYFLQYKNADYCPRKTKFVNESDNNIFEHYCSFDKGSQGCTIMYNNNVDNEVIGLNLGNNKGYFIQEITREFYKQERFKKYNEIKKEQKEINNIINAINDEITLIHKIYYERPNVFYRGDIYLNYFEKKSLKYKLFGEKFVENNKNFLE